MHAGRCRAGSCLRWWVSAAWGGEDAFPIAEVPGATTDLGFGLADPAEAADAQAPEIIVDVAGAVARPGLHRLRPGDRVGDAIEAAGGFAPRADLAASAVDLNLAQPLEDGAKVLVPELGTARPSGSNAADDGRIDLNHASQSELESLPGIGPVTAGKIIDARSGERFDTVGELRSRGLVGEKVYEDIEGLVRAG
jgi:competence protein ComEA